MGWGRGLPLSGKCALVVVLGLGHSGLGFQKCLQLPCCFCRGTGTPKTRRHPGNRKPFLPSSTTNALKKLVRGYTSGSHRVQPRLRTTSYGGSKVWDSLGELVKDEVTDSESRG